ncbi:MAG: 16S rRNA (cytosine(1402)-N(4))-methyltransferase RsmH [bacterium]
MHTSPFLSEPAVNSGPLEPSHVPVLKETVVDLLVTDHGGVYVDCTVGEGGHAEAILERLEGAGVLIGLDVDAEAVETARRRMADFGDRAKILQADFSTIKEILNRVGITCVNGVLFDLGLSSLQLDSAGRGFSYRLDGPLDMRMDLSQSKTARDVVNWYTRNELTRIFRDYGEEKHAARISRAVIRAREGHPIESTSQLAAIVQSAIPRWNPQKTLSRIFQAIRIEVNDELYRLKMGLREAIEILGPKGRIAAIAYHSLEDRVVKSIFSQKSKGCICPPDLPVCACGRKKELRLITKGALRPAEEEMQENIRARSARLRVAEKVQSQNFGALEL